MGALVIKMETKISSQDEQPISQVIITFAAPGSAIMTIDFKNIAPLQAAAAAWYLEKAAESGFIQEQMAQREKESLSHIAVPGGARGIARP